MLSFQVTDPGDPAATIITIECDAVGIAVLLGALARLVGERASHCLLLAPSCGGRDLSETTLWGAPAIGEVIISYAEGD